MDSGNILSVNVPNAISIGVMGAALVLIIMLARKAMAGRARAPVNNTPRASWPASGGN